MAICSPDISKRWSESVAMALWVKLHVRVELSHVFQEPRCGRRRPGREQIWRQTRGVSKQAAYIRANVTLSDLGIMTLMVP